MDENRVEMVQMEDWRRPEFFSKSSIPLFLIHDGGGTVFSYHCLEPLKCHVYGIPNPHFESGARFAGGLSEMGRLYAKWIRQTVSQEDFPANSVEGTTDILLGGWSLGGLLSLQVTKELENTDVNIVGILMIDSIYPDKSLGPIVFEPWDSKDKTKTQVLSRRAMEEACRMLNEWELPNLSGGYVRPRIILLRATQSVPSDGDTQIRAIDSCREDKMLGWDKYDKTLFEEVIDVEGHHFDLFTIGRVVRTSEVIREALKKLAMFA